MGMVPEPEFGERLTRLLLGGPAADCPLLTPALREPAAAARVDAVTRRVSAALHAPAAAGRGDAVTRRMALGEPFSVVARGDGRVEASAARARYGVFYSRNADGLADRVQIYSLEPVRSAPRLLRGPIFRGVLLAVPAYLAVLIALAPSTIARAVWTVAVLAFLSGQWTNHRWDLTGVRLRPWWVGLSAAVLAVGWLGAGRFGTSSFGVDAVVAVVLVAAAMPTTLARRRPKGPPLSVALPLSVAGYVLQGGASRWLNHHHGHEQQRWAVDLLPVSGHLWRNPMQGRVEVVAPVSGTIVRAVDGYPDESAVVPPYGNHVVIVDRGQTRLFLCHLAEGSVTVTEGQAVSAGEVLGHVGNSGRSTEPHLHLHAVGPDGTAVPLLVEGKPPSRGRLLRGRDR
jgi:Peptidase family M23